MIGQIIGAFRIEQKIGEGGMGAVYRGRDLMLEREVAVKALRPELARQPELVARFRSEAVTLARLNHSHIATLYNFLRHGDDYFMVMEFVRGRTLDELIRQTGALEIERAVRLFCQALEGIAHAHALGVIHRDIKPANIMLTANDEVKVMDFGIARVLGSARQTKTGRLIGTLEYMSPEQMRSQETDARSDIYSLGILLYEMLTGRVPFQASSDYELMRAQVEDEPVAPRDFKDDIPLAVELAILRALAKDPAARFQSAIEFRAALVSAVPAAAIRPEPAKVIAEAETPIRATRAAAGFDEVNFSGDWAGFDEQIKETRLPQRQSGFDRHSGTFTLKLPSFLLTARQSVEARLGPLNWKHYSAACAAILALGLGLSSMRGNQETPAPKQAEAVVTPATSATILPAPTVGPVIEPVITPPETAVIPPVESAPTPARAKRAATPKPRRQSEQQADQNRPAPPPSRAEPQRAQAAPTPTPAPEKKKWWEKAAEVGIGVTDSIIRKKKGRP